MTGPPSDRFLPTRFLWGAATSHHQVEDDEPSDWSDWTRSGARTIDGSSAGRALEWWSGRAEEDLSLAARLGHNAHRLGLSWARLEPEPDRFDEAAFDRYARLLDHAHREGLAVMATLFHFTLPRWLAKGLTSVSRLVETVSGGRRLGPLPLQTFALMAHEVTVNDARAREELGYAPVMPRTKGLEALKQPRR